MHFTLPTMHKYNARARGIAGVSGEGRGGEGWWAGSHDPVRFNSAARKKLRGKWQRAEFEKKEIKKERRACTR